MKADTSITPLTSETTKAIEYTPYVNVDELHMDKNDTEWTVYLGTNVDPKTQLKKLFESIPVRQVVKEGGTTEDIYIESANQMYYEHGTTVDNEDKEAPAETYQTLPLSHYLTYGTSTSTNKNLSGVLDDLLETLKNSDTVSLKDIVYTEYGHSAGYFTVTLTKDVNSDALSDGAPEAHDTKKTGKEVEAYTVNVTYTPYTSTIPAAPTYDHTTLGGTSGVITTGSGDDEVKSENSHKINVYSKPLDIMKVNEQGMPITAPKQATFELLKVWNEGDSNFGKVIFGTTAGYAGYKLNGEPLDGRTYSVIDQKTTDENGIAHFGVDASALLKSGEYILIEKEEPDGYEKDVNAKTISIVTSDADLNFYSNLAMEPSLATMPYNWNQGVRFILRENDGETSSETVLDYVDENGRIIKLYEPRADETDENLRNYVFSNIDNNKEMIKDPNGVFRTRFINMVSAIDVTFKKVGVNNSDETGTQSNLGGAKFTLYEATGENKDTKGSVVVIDNEAFQDKTSDASSGIFWTGVLPIGNYLLEETEAPDGYTKIGVLIKVTVNKDGVSLGYVGTVGTPPYNEPTNDGDTWTITAINVAGASLPSTGGPGTTLFYLLGFLLTAFAGSGMALRKHWRKAA